MKLSERMILGLEATKPTKTKYYVTRLKEWWQKVNPFNYRVFIYNKACLNNPSSAAKVGYDGKYLFLLQDDGKPFRVQTAMTIYDSVNKPTRAKVELFVNLTDIVKIDNPR